MHRIKIHIEAEHEIITASQYDKQNVDGLGDKFLDDIEDAVLQIERFPRAWSIYEQEYRHYL